MASSWSRKDSQKGGSSPLLDLGMPHQERGPRHWVEDAMPQQLVMRDLEEFSKICGLQRSRKKWWQKLGRVLKGGNKQHREEQRAARIQALAAEILAKLDLPEEPGTGQKTTQGEDDRQEEKGTVLKVCSVVPHHKEGGWDEPVVGCEAQNGHVPRGGDGHKGEMGQTEPLVRADATRDEEGRTSSLPHSLGLGVEDKDVAAIHREASEQVARDDQDFNPPSAEGRSGEEQRRQVWEELHLREDTARCERRSVRDLAPRLTEVIPKTETKVYFMETVNESGQLKQWPGEAVASREDSSEEVDSSLDDRVIITMEEQYPQSQGLAMCCHVRAFSGGDDQRHQDMLFWNNQIWEDPDDDRKFMALRGLTMLRSKEQWEKEFGYVWAQHEMDCGLVSDQEVVYGEVVGLQRQQRLSEEEIAAMEYMLPYLLDYGVVVEHRSPYNIPLSLKRKDDGKTWRLMLKCRASKATPAVEESLNITKAVTTLSPKSRYFSKVDLSNASYAIPLADDCRHKFAFTFKNKQYIFTRLPQGFCSTTSIIHRRVTKMLSQLPEEDKPWVVSYVDDILIAGESRMETEARTTRVLKLIEKTGFKAKFEKAQLVEPRVDYLKMTIGPYGREILASRLETIQKAPRPRNVHDVRTLLGQFGFLQDYIHDYWKLARPLLNLTKAQVRWEWGARQEQALKRLKFAVLEAPPLRFPDKSQPFVISLTTSKWVVGATLLQEDEDGHLVPVGRSSHILKNQKVCYLLQEKRCLAAIWAVQAFQTLTGPAPILVQMPYCPWKYFLRGKVLGSYGTNLHPDTWTLLLVNGVMSAKRPQPERGLPSTLVSTAPSLQKLPSHVPRANVWFLEVFSTGFAATNLEERWLLGVAEDSSVLHVEMVALTRLLHHHRCSLPFYLYTSCSSLVKSLQNQFCEEWEMLAGSDKDLWLYILSWVKDNPGMLHIKCVERGGIEDPDESTQSQKVGNRAEVMSTRSVGSREIWEPSKHEKQEIIAWCHNQLHKGVQKTLERVRQVASWEGDREQVVCWVRRCLKCAAGRDGACRMPSQREEGPWSLLQVGYISGLTKTVEGYCSLLVVEDEFSGWVEAFPMDSSAERKVEETNEVLNREIFERYGTPCAIRIPPSPRFLHNAVSAGMKFSCEILKLDHKKPATAILQRLAWGAGKEWVKMLPLLLTGIRSIRVRRGALSPYQTICSFPLEMRWSNEVGSCPGDNILRWLQGLQETSCSTGPKPRCGGTAQRRLLQGHKQNHGVVKVGRDLYGHQS